MTDTNHPLYLLNDALATLAIAAGTPFANTDEDDNRLDNLTHYVGAILGIEGAVAPTGPVAPVQPDSEWLKHQWGKVAGSDEYALKIRELIADADGDRKATGWLHLTPEQAHHLLAVVEEEAGVSAPALPPITFKPAGEHDFYRDQWESVNIETHLDDFDVELQLTATDHEGHDGYTDLLRVTPDQARRILIMLADDAAAESE